jgi:putative membrane protein
MNKDNHTSLSLEMAASYLIWMCSIVWLLLSGKYQIFLRQSFWALMLWAFAILGLFAFSIIKRISFRNNPVYGASAYIRLGTIVLPIFYILMAQNQSLSSYAFKKRSTVQPSQSIQSAVKGAVTLPDDGKVSIFQIMENIDDWKDKRVVTEGMVYRDDNVPEKHIVIYRFLMTCCVADASPLNILVETDNPDGFKDDQWVRVEGILSLKKVGDIDFSPHIKADRITPIAPPKDKYLYPSFY